MDKWIVYTRMTRSGGLRDLVAHSGYVCAERYFREGMLALPYRFHKFNGAWREGLCEYAANGSHNLAAHSGCSCARFQNG